MRQPTPDQILAWNERRGPQSGIAHNIISRIEALRVAWRKSEEPLLAEFIPIRIATCVEVHSRDAVRELVDSGGRYLESARTLTKNSKLDLIYADHLAGQKLSVGDIVAHSVSINGIDAVISIFSLLIDEFVPKLKASHPRWSEDANSWPLDPIIRDYDETVGTLSKMFEIRHVLSHELPQHAVIEGEQVEQICDAAIEFIDASDWVTITELNGSVARTQSLMNANAGELLLVASKELANELEKAAKLPGIDAGRLNEAQAKWEQFADFEASLIASNVEGGSMYPLLKSSSKEYLTKIRIDQLRNLVDEWMH